MTNSKDGGLRQMDEAETDKMAGKCILDHLVRLVPNGLGTPQFSCSCGMCFPVSERSVAAHLRWVIELRAEEIGAVPHPSWGGFAKPEADAPAGSAEARPYWLSAEWRAVPVWVLKDILEFWNRPGVTGQRPINLETMVRGIVYSMKAETDPSSKQARLERGNLAMLEQAERLIADLAGLLKSDSYPAHVGTETLDRAEAFLQHGDEAFREVDPGPAIGGAFEDVRTAAVAEADRLDEEEWTTLQELINAIGCLEGVGDRVVAYLHGRGFDDPQQAIDDLREKAF